MDYTVLMGFMVLMGFIPHRGMLMEGGKYVDWLFNIRSSFGGDIGLAVVAEITF